jgi:pilus assembly protein CpaE
MIKTALQPAEFASMPADVPARDEHIAPAPRVSVQAFCETVETAAAVQAAGEDRRLAKAHLKIQMGGMTAALEAYRSARTKCWPASTRSPKSATPARASS